VIFGNFSAVVGLVFDTIKLKYETYRADTEHLFVTTIPAYISWFGDNFFNIIETAFSAVYSIISNHISKIADTFKAFWDFISSGGGTDLLGELGDIAGRSYLEGFENSIESLPNVAARAMTATEKELQASIGVTAGKLAEEYESKMAARTVKIGGAVGDSIADTIDLKLKKTADEIEKKSDKKIVDIASKPNAAIATGDALQAQESRLLTRGTGSTNLLQQIAKGIDLLVSQATKQTEADLVAASAAAQLANQMQGAPKITIQGVP